MKKIIIIFLFVQSVLPGTNMLCYNICCEYIHLRQHFLCCVYHTHKRDIICNVVFGSKNIYAIYTQHNTQKLPLRRTKPLLHSQVVCKYIYKYIFRRIQIEILGALSIEISRTTHFCILIYKHLSSRCKRNARALYRIVHCEIKRQTWASAKICDLSIVYTSDSNRLLLMHLIFYILPTNDDHNGKPKAKRYWFDMWFQAHPELRLERILRNILWNERREESCCARKDDKLWWSTKRRWLVILEYYLIYSN